MSMIFLKRSKNQMSILVMELIFLGDTPRRMASARSMAEWVLAPALCRGDSAPLWEGLDAPRPPAAEGGYAFAEAYAQEAEDFSALDFTGPEAMYRKAGFEEVRRWGKTIVMRKKL